MTRFPHVGELTAVICLTICISCDKLFGVFYTPNDSSIVVGCRHKLVCFKDRYSINVSLLIMRCTTQPENSCITWFGTRELCKEGEYP